MPVVEADFLKAVIDPSDKLHRHAVKALAKLGRKQWHLASSAFIELDLLLKSEGIGATDRSSIFQSVKTEIPRDIILPITHEVMAKALGLQASYPNIRDFYFDSIHLAIAILHDARIVSSDALFGRIREVDWIKLQQL